MRRAESWQWSSLGQRLPQAESILADGPLPLPSNWIDLVNHPQTDAELHALRTSIQRGTPFGTPRWIKRAARQLGLEASIRPRGRPRKAKK